ncbi:MAG: glycosyltransferase family 4 protein [Sedimentisphaerales bacterium]
MHILYIHQYFATPLGCTGTRSYEFARRWVAKKHKVTMLTTTAQLTCEDLAEAKGRFIKKYAVSGINVLALAIPYRQQMGMFKRCLAFCVFSSLASVAAFFLKFDVLYVTSTPITVGIPALIARWFRRKKFIFEVRDQWPAAMVKMGFLKNRFLIGISTCLEKVIYKYSAAIVTVSDGMAEGVKEIAGETKLIYVIPNGADLDFFRPDIANDEIRRKNQWNSKFVLLYAGAIGRINGLDLIIDVAEKLKNHKSILFVLVGKGSNKGILENRVEKLGLTNVQILPSVPKQKLAGLFSASDVIMATISNFPSVEQSASLNKFYDGLSAGKPVLLNYYGWQGKLLEDNHAGFGCKLYDVDEFAEKVLYLSSHPEQVTEMGRNARRLAVERFDRDKLAAQALEIVSGLR